MGIRWVRLVDVIAEVVAACLPRRVVYHATIRLGAAASTGPFSDTVVTDLLFIEAVRRWDQTEPWG